MKDIHLCEYCATIDFDLIDHVSASDFANLRATGTRSHRSLIRTVGRSSTTCWAWSLGRQDRIDESSLTCSLCYAICQLLEQNPHVRDFWQSHDTALTDPVCLAGIDVAGTIRPPEGGSSWEGTDLRRISLGWQQMTPENSNPGFVQNVSVHDMMPKLVECFQTCTPRPPRPATLEDVFNPSNGDPDALLFGGRVRPKLVDPKLPRQWLSDCVTNHGVDCSLPMGDMSDRRMSIFRLVDIQAENIQEFRDVDISSLSYTALSYVWGGPQNFTLERDKLVEMQKPRSLKPDKVPRTLWDAILFTKDLDIPFLWIDALCIIQDDDEDKSIQLDRMSDIYRQATLTIAVGHAQCADAGIPGIRVPRQAQQTEVPLPQTHGGAHMSLLTTLSPRREFYLPATDDCIWGTRAWTLQEHALSRRLVFFREQQVLWLCACARWSEETHAETNIARTSWRSMQDTSLLNTKDQYTDLWRTFEILIRNFKMRKMSYLGDALDAFSGILVELEKRTGEKFLWGMATSSFEQSLCWKPYATHPPPRRTCLTSRKMTSLSCRVPFPSWSWLGWGGLHNAIMYGNKSYTPVITCFVLRNSPIRLERVSPRDAPRDQLMSLDDVISSDPALSLEQLRSVPDDQYLCFRTQCLSFNHAEKMDLEDVKVASSNSRLKDIKQAPSDTRFFSNSNASVVSSELFCFHSEDERELASLQEHLFGPVPNTGSRILVDVESKRIVGEVYPCRWREDEDQVDLILLAHEKSRHGEDAIVLEVERRGGVMQRRSIGRVEKSSWEKSRPVTKVVILN